MELQLALDLITRKERKKVAAAVKNDMDILELGTPFSYVNPISEVKKFKELLPGIKILSDFKIMDGGREIAELAYSNGADLTTVSARTWDDTIKQAIACAREYGREILVDLMGVPEEQIAERTLEVDAMKPDYICVHRAVTVGGSASPEEPLRKVREVVKNAKVAVAGGINCETLKRVVACNPDLVIVGSSIASAKDPVAVAKEMRRIMEEK